MCVIKGWEGSNEQTEKGLLAAQRILSQNGQRGDSGKGSWSRALMDEQGLAKAKRGRKVGEKKKQAGRRKACVKIISEQEHRLQWTTDTWQEVGEMYRRQQSENH